MYAFTCLLVYKERFKTNDLSFYLKPERKANQIQRKKKVTKRKEGNKGKDRNL